MKLRPESFLILALATVVCFLGGLLATVAVGSVPGVGAHPTATLPPPAPSSTPISQVSVLLLGVDSLAAPRPILEACWVLTFQPGVSHYYFVGFSPQAEVRLPGTPAERRLTDIYAMDRQIQVGSSLFTRDAVQVISPGLLRPQAEVVYDRQMLAASVDMLGGIVLHGERLDGTALLARYDMLPADAAEQLAFQQAALDAITDAVAGRSWSPEVMASYFLQGQHWNPDPEWFVAVAQAELPLVEPGIYITIAPLLVETMPAP